MGLLVVHGNAQAVPSQAVDWSAVQFAQYEHDEKYHREISRLTVQDRLKHMTLHFAKYAGRILAPHNDAVFQRTTIDTMIIAVSCANILNLALENQDFPQTCIGGRSDFARELAISAGRMATACEKMDHLEDFPFRPALTTEAIYILALTLSVFQLESWNPTEEMTSRLASVKKNTIFHGRF